MNFTAIQSVADKNYMFLLYNETHAISFDPAHSQLIDLALSKDLKKEHYTEEELANEKDHPKRILTTNFTTHMHYDHAGGNESLSKMYPGIKLVSHYESGCRDLDVFNISGSQIKAIATPGHTMDSMCFLIDEKYLITGDTVFKLGCGAIFEGTSTDMSNSFKNIIKHVKKDAIMLYGHYYDEVNLRFAQLYKEEIPQEIIEKRFLSLEEEIMYNPFLADISATELGIRRAKKDVFV